jgi:hypothetical protein
MLAYLSVQPDGQVVMMARMLIGGPVKGHERVEPKKE